MPRDQITHAQNELTRAQAQHKVLHLQYDRLNRRRKVKARPGGAAGSGRCAGQGSSRGGAGGSRQVEPAIRRKASSQPAQAKREHDQALFDYSKITAPFAGVVTQRYANLGTLMQAGTNSSTQACRWSGSRRTIFSGW